MRLSSLDGNPGCEGDVFHDFSPGTRQSSICPHLGGNTIRVYLLSQGFKHSPTIADNALAEVLAEIPVPPQVTVCQNREDTLIRAENQQLVEFAVEHTTQK